MQIYYYFAECIYLSTRRTKVHTKVFQHEYVVTCSIEYVHTVQFVAIYEGTFEGILYFRKYNATMYISTYYLRRYISAGYIDSTYILRRYIDLHSIVYDTYFNYVCRAACVKRRVCNVVLVLHSTKVHIIRR